MDTVKSANGSVYRTVEGFLPQRVRSSLALLSDSTLEELCEIRLRASGVSTVTVYADTLYICDTGLSHQPSRCVCCTSDELDTFLYKLCGGSVYAYETTMRQGFISVCGVRVGLAGKAAVTESGAVMLSRVDCVNIRLPHAVPGCAKDIYDRILSEGFPKGGILIASAPGVGKTTMLRDLAVSLSRPMPQRDGMPDKVHRVTVIDEREELYRPAWFKGCAVDVLSGMRKEKALEWAIRSLSPEVMVLDEIGSEADARTVLEAHLGGVKILASVHETDMEGILSKPSLRSLCEYGVFGAAYLLERRGKTVCGTWLPFPDHA